MSVSVVGVVGAGFMGSGIAESAATAGKQVVLYEAEQPPLERSRERLTASVSKAVARGVTAAHHGRKRGRGYYDFAPAARGLEARA